MSTRQDRTSGAELYARKLQDLLKRPENKFCADCGDKAPRWASVNLGMFICMRCAGIHRQMGTHITKVKSTTLDSWIDEWVKMMEDIGNERGNAIWEASNPPHKPNVHTGQPELERYLRDKYDRKLFHADNARNRRQDDYSRQAPPQRDEPRHQPRAEEPRRAAPAPPARKAVNIIPVSQHQPVSAPAPAPAPVAVQSKPAPGIASLLDFDDPPAAAPAPAASFNADFGSLSSAPASQAHGQHDFADFGAFNGSAAPAAPVDAKSDIMKMFESSNPMGGWGGQQQQFMGGMQQGQMGHMHMMGGMPGQMGGMPGQMGGMPGQMGGQMGGGMPGQMGGMNMHHMQPHMMQQQPHMMQQQQQQQFPPHMAGGQQGYGQQGFGMPPQQQQHQNQQLAMHQMMGIAPAQNNPFAQGGHAHGGHHHAPHDNPFVQKSPAIHNNHGFRFDQHNFQ